MCLASVAVLRWEGGGWDHSMSVGHATPPPSRGFRGFRGFRGKEAKRDVDMIASTRPVSSHVDAFLGHAKCRFVVPAVVAYVNQAVVKHVTASTVQFWAGASLDGRRGSRE